MAEERKYSKLTNEEIIPQLLSILSSKIGPLADLGSAPFGRALIEIFSGTTDINSFIAEKAWSESWLESAKNTPSVYIGARSLGYSIRRPIPPRAGFGISLKKTGTKPNVKVVIPKNTAFSVQGQNLLTLDDVELVYDRNDADFTSGIMKIKSGRAILISGTVRTRQFFSNGEKFQEFIIVDSSFSDWFGNGDPNYIEPDVMKSRINRFTTITSDSGLSDNFTPVEGHEDKIYWRLSRRGLFDPNTENISGVDFSDSENKTRNFTIYVNTSNDGNVFLRFGDGITSAIPFGTIEVKYISTAGEAGNVLNIAGSALTTDSNDILITQVNGQESDLTLDDLNIALTTDIRGGLNIESIESIKNNASKIFSTLDSLGSTLSYKLFLTRQADVKYANAFGEDLISRPVNGKFNIKYANIVRYTLLRDLYREKNGVYYVTDPFEYYVSGYKTPGLIYTWLYDYDQLPNDTDVAKLEIDIEKLKTKLVEDELSILDSNDNVITIDDFIKDYIPKGKSLVPTSVFNSHITPEDFIEDGSPLQAINDALNRRGYTTLEDNHIYVMPVVHDLTMNIDLTLHEGSVFSDIKAKVIQKIYKYLKENTDFSVPVYRSKIESLIQSFPEVAGVNIVFSPRTNQFRSLELDKILWLSSDAAAFIKQDSVLDINSIEISLSFDYNEIDLNGDISDTSSETVEIELLNQIENVQSKIKEYFISKFTYFDKVTGINKIRTGEISNNLSEEEINKFTSYIWSIAMNEVYNSLFKKYLDAKNKGVSTTANMYYNLIETLKTWYFKNGVLLFKDSDTIENLTESSTNTLFKYKTYILEYIKLVRRIFATYTAERLMDKKGNITNYSNDNEIVQFSISSSNIAISVGK